VSTDDLSGFSMLDLFKGEVESQTVVLNAGLLALERNADDTTVVESLMRASHSIKGAARIVQLEDAVQIAHLMEDCFVAVQEGTLRLSDAGIDIIFKAVDMLGRIGQGESAQLAGAPLEALLRSLESIRQPGDRDESPEPVSEQRELSAFSMFDLFCSEVRSHCEVINQALASGLPEGRELEPLMRAAHSMKGAARVIGLEPIVTLAGSLEELFSSAMEGRISLADGYPLIIEPAVILLLSSADTTEAGFSRWLETNRSLLEELAAALAVAATGGDISAAFDRFAPQQVAPAPREVGRATPETSEGGPAELAGREVRITSENLNRLMALAGETVVETRWLDPFAESLVRIKQRQIELVDMLDRLQTSLSDIAHRELAETTLSEATQSANECLGMINARLNDFETFSRRSTNLSGRLYRQVIATRMRPFSEGVKPFPRMIRDIARKLGKKTRIMVEGLSTEVDRDILEKLEAPLSHLLRNAVDHGIEKPAQRKAVGKPEEGTIRLEAAHRGGMLLITVTDDGGGIGIGRLREKVVERNLANSEMAAKLTEAELFEFLFLPGFSTASAVTEISGRGVGLDVVQTMVQEVGGVVRAASREGEGTTFFLQLPITRSVMRTLLVEINGEPFAVPLPRIERALRVRPEEIELLENRQYIQYEGSNIGLISGHQVLDLPETKFDSAAVSVVVLSDQLTRYGVVVDRFIGEHDLVVRPLNPRLGKVAEIQAVSVMQDGSPVLILDVDDVVRTIDNLLTGGRLRKVGGRGEVEEVRSRKRILVVDDSITVREVERKLLENNGYLVDVAVDGMDGWNAVRTGSYDLIISDIDMPRMTGIELVTLIKGDKKLQSLPVVIVSYKDREEDRLKGLDAGANYYLTKSSFHDETMLNAVVDLIGRSDG